MCEKSKIDPISPGAALFCMLMNIFFIFPFGTFVHACLSVRYTNSAIMGFCQLVALALFPPIGWVWGIIYGCLIYSVSIENAHKNTGGYILVSGGIPVQT